MNVIDRILHYINIENIPISTFEQNSGLSNGYIKKVKRSPSLQKCEDILNAYPDINKEWLLTGKGEMYSTDILKTQIVEMDDCLNLIPLLPISAQGGTLNEFFTSVKYSDCEKIISPIKGADYAITVSGDSMHPEYPSGSKILIKKINERSFIEWGRCYVLDTCNGAVIKKLAAPIEPDPEYGLDYVNCISVNESPLYGSFKVSTKDIHGIYRVLMMLTEK